MIDTWAWALETGAVFGVDEAGRGPLAGPVVAAAVHLGSGPLPPALIELDDSKKLSARTRAALVHALPRAGASVGVGVVSAARIDEINILEATREAMHLATRRATARLGQPAGVLLVDGNLPIPSYGGLQFPLVKGDGRAWAIAAASVVAKVVRDQLMGVYHQRFPAYGFAQHKGYGTVAHRAALAAHGPSPIHRTSFRWSPP